MSNYKRVLGLMDDIIDEFGVEGDNGHIYFYGNIFDMIRDQIEDLSLKKEELPASVIFKLRIMGHVMSDFSKEEEDYPATIISSITKSVLRDMIHVIVNEGV